MARGIGPRDGPTQVGLRRRVLSQPYLRSREVSEPRQLARPLADLAEDGERLLVAPDRRLIVALQCAMTPRLFSMKPTLRRSPVSRSSASVGER